jgi:hypothetical protein
MILVPDEFIYDNMYITPHMCHTHNLPKHVSGLKKVYMYTLHIYTLL